MLIDDSQKADDDKKSEDSQKWVPWTWRRFPHGGEMLLPISHNCALVNQRKGAEAQEIPSLKVSVGGN